jgi:hypothetical protein
MPAQIAEMGLPNMIVAEQIAYFLTRRYGRSSKFICFMMLCLKHNDTTIAVQTPEYSHKVNTDKLNEICDFFTLPHGWSQLHTEVISRFVDEFDATPAHRSTLDNWITKNFGRRISAAKNAAQKSAVTPIAPRHASNRLSNSHSVVDLRKSKIRHQ